MSDTPYIPFYTSDFLAGTSGMTAASKGVYITLLCLIYEAEAPLPQSWDTLARRCGCTLPAFKKAVEALQDDGKISVTGAGIWSDKCQKHIAQRRERQSSAKAAAKKRWEKIQENQRPTDKAALPTQCQPEPEPEPDKKEDTKVSSKKDENGFDAFWSEVPRKVAKGNARKAYRSALKKADAQSILDGMKRYAASVKGKDPKYIAHPATWLNGERWADEEDATADNRTWRDKPQSEWTHKDRQEHLQWTL